MNTFTENEEHMSDVTAISADEIVTAVKNDPAIDATSFDQLKAAVGVLATVISDKHDVLVGFASLCETTLTLGRRLNEMGCTYDAGGTLESQMQTLTMYEGYFEELLYLSGATEAEVMLGPEMGLNDEMRQLYLSGTLTFGTLARCQPSVFLT